MVIGLEINEETLSKEETFPHIKFVLKKTPPTFWVIAAGISMVLFHGIFH